MRIKAPDINKHNLTGTFKSWDESIQFEEIIHENARYSYTISYLYYLFHIIPNYCVKEKIKIGLKN
jgi:hypothetical protein